VIRRFLDRLAGPLGSTLLGLTLRATQLAGSAVRDREQTERALVWWRRHAADVEALLRQVRRERDEARSSLNCGKTGGQGDGGCLLVDGPCAACQRAQARLEAEAERLRASAERERADAYEALLACGLTPADRADKHACQLPGEGMCAACVQAMASRLDHKLDTSTKQAVDLAWKAFSFLHAIAPATHMHPIAIGEIRTELEAMIAKLLPEAVEEQHETMVDAEAEATARRRAKLVMLPACAWVTSTADMLREQTGITAAGSDWRAIATECRDRAAEVVKRADEADRAAAALAAAPVAVGQTRENETGERVEVCGPSAQPGRFELHGRGYFDAATIALRWPRVVAMGHGTAAHPAEEGGT
jgi:hypothetical protein